MTDVMSSAEGFEIWNPAAPCLGMNCGSIWKRMALSPPHQPARRGRNRYACCDDDDVDEDVEEDNDGGEEDDDDDLLVLISMLLLLPVSLLTTTTCGAPF